MSVLRKASVVAIFFLLALSFFELKDIILTPSEQEFKRLIFALVIAIVVSYTNGFELVHKGLVKRLTRKSHEESKFS